MTAEQYEKAAITMMDKFYDEKYDKFMTLEDAKKLGDEIGVDWEEVDVAEFRFGVKEEMEHGSELSDKVNVTNDDLSITAKIANAHFMEMPDYYVRLEMMENEAGGYWESRSRKLADRAFTKSS